MKKNVPPNLNYAWAGLMIEELKRLGVDTFFISPGSRSSPLTLSAAEHGANVIVHFDERGTGFAALGYARATGRPAVVITTSGSAVANLFPSVCEASQDAVPMLIITADRPPELRDTGANQTMDQVKIFAGYTRWQVDMPCPDEKIEASFVLSTIDYACSRAMFGHPGPVHINQMFREPLAPVSVKDASLKWLASVKQWLAGSKPQTVYVPVETSISADGMSTVLPMLKSARRGVIVAGSISRDRDRQSVLSVARKLGWPVLPDIRSGLRISANQPQVIHMADQILLSDKAVKILAPDVILYLGARITSKRIQSFIRKSNAQILMVNEWPVRLDPDGQVAVRLVADLQSFAERLVSPLSRTPTAWLKKWKKLDGIVTEYWQDEIRNTSTITEPLAAAMISTQLRKGHAMFLASSMPVRDMEMYGNSEQEVVPVVSNRGVSGIDGNAATAFGYANGSKMPVTLVIGDLALLHDLNSLALVAKSRTPVVVIAVNNNGGGIFSFLPISETPRHFETCFGTPHGVNFSQAAVMFGLPYKNPATLDEMKQAYKRAVESGRSALIEISTDRIQNLKEHKRIQSLIKKLVDHGFKS